MVFICTSAVWNFAFRAERYHNASANERLIYRCGTVSLRISVSDSFVWCVYRDPHLPASLQIDLSNSEAIFGGALQKSMTDLPWSRSSLASQVKSTPA